MFDVWVLIPPYLCEGECEGELEAVLLHELAHVKGRDTFLLFVASVLRVFLFVHPLYWLLWKDLRLNQELLADAWAAQRVGSAATYAERLVRVAQHSGALISWTLPVLQAIRRRSEFYQRMDYLLRRGQNTRLEVSRRTSLGMAGVFVLAALAGGTVNLRAIERPAGSPGGYTQNLVEATEMEGRGLAYLRASQEASGGWRSPTGPGVTGLAVRALVQGGDSPEMPHIQRALTFIERMHQSDGGYYSSESPTYNTAIIISMLAVLPGDGYRDSIERGRHFLTEMQMPARSSNFYGSRQQSASMSTERLPEIDALSEAGVRGSKDAQSMLSPLFIHSPGDRADGTVLSGYGTLTYVQLKSLLYSGVAHDDPRVQALVGTVRANFRFDTNPIYDAPQGQFYFYYAASKALRAYGDDKIIDGKGISHAWRSELADRLAELQETNGSWVNRKSDYWLENDPVLVTIYSILALQEARR
jgi:squalene-hopene/tetraprenyl-beta-curcumene cyclase